MSRITVHHSSIMSSINSVKTKSNLMFWVSVLGGHTTDMTTLLHAASLHVPTRPINCSLTTSGVAVARSPPAINGCLDDWRVALILWLSLALRPTPASHQPSQPAWPGRTVRRHVPHIIRRATWLHRSLHWCFWLTVDAAAAAAAAADYTAAVCS